MPVWGLAAILALSSPTTPEAYLGFRVGADTKLASYQQLSGYFDLLDKASDRLQIREIGVTTEGKRMFVAEISSPGNLKNLKKIYEMGSKLHDPRKVRDAKEEAELLKSAKTSIVLNCSMHASEVAASQMSMELAYNLVTGNDADTKQILDNTVVQLIACANPDGMDLVKNWYDKTLGTKYETAPMPWLYQKYVGHDNNRDWWLVSQKETENVTKYLYNVGFPTVLYDIHQMGGSGARMFVPPFFDPTNPNIDPITTQSIMLLGAHMATDLAAAGKKGVVWGAIYDNWWQGGMRTTPQRHNVVAILTEAASARTASPVDVKPENLTGHDRGLPIYQAQVNFPDPWPAGRWTLRDIVDYELITTRSMLRVGARYRDQWVKNQLTMSKKQIELGTNEAPTAWIVPEQPNREGVAQLLRSLMLAGVEVHRANSELSVGELTYPAGTYVLRCDQPYRAHLKDLMEIQKYPERRVYPGGPVDRPYDVAGWTAPLVLGVESLQVGKAPIRGELERFTQVPDLKKVDPLGGQKPRVALYQSWNASMDEGWTRFVWEQYGVAYTTVHNEDLRKGNLGDRFDCIFFPGESANSIMNGVSAERTFPEYAGGIGTAGLANLKTFAEAGGTVVLMDEASALAARLDLPFRNTTQGIGRDKFYCPGSVLRTKVSTRHPLAAGMEEWGIAYFSNSAAFEPPQDLTNVAVVASYAPENTLLSGFLLGEEVIRGKAAVLDWSVGKGHVVMFGFPVQHRGQTMATFGFMWNAMKQSVAAR